jgi:hypothetical protein
MAGKENPYLGKISQGAAQDVRSPLQKTDSRRAAVRREPRTSAGKSK